MIRTERKCAANEQRGMDEDTQEKGDAFWEKCARWASALKTAAAD